MTLGGTASWIAPALVRLETYYWTPGGPSEKTQQSMVEMGNGNWIQALAVFYAHYAYERAGAPRSWGPLARDLIEGFDPHRQVKKVEKTLWQQFTEQVKKPNPKVNPLAPGQSKPPATRFIVSLIEDEHNLIRWAARQLKSGSAQATNRSLQQLQGIGPKIAAFFLRDIVTSHGIAEGMLDDRRAILPVDVWVRRGVAALAGWKVMVDDEQSDKKIQELAIRKADELGLRVATLDAGLWVLGARFARSPARMSQALDSPDAFHKMVQEEILRAEGAAHALKSVLSDLAPSPVAARPTA